MYLPQSITICEVGLRDGLQNEKTVLSTEQKLELLESGYRSGLRHFEVGSFVNPRRVPAQADTDEVFRRMTPRDDTECRGLIMNARGLERAELAGVTKAKIVVSASRTHCRENQNNTPEGVLEALRPLVADAATRGVTISAAIATAFGCPFEGVIDLELVWALAQGFVDMGVRELSLSDTVGMANPRQVDELCQAAQKRFPMVVWNLHFHNTHGFGFANVLAGMEAGITRFDASFAGLGGCPFAPGASGNIATEDLVCLCDQMGVETGVDLDKAIDTAKRVRAMVDHDTESFTLRAGKIPQGGARS